LPTVVHWGRAATIRNSALIVPLSNFAGQGTRPVGSSDDPSGFGTYDMAGNVREWCWNASGDERFILGGGWNDHPFLFTDAFAQAPFDRSVANGIRLVKYLGDERGVVAAREPLRRTTRDFIAERPASDEVYAAYLQMFQYDRTPLDAKVLESVDQGEWTRELVRMNAAYAGDTLLAYLFLPKRGQKPWPTVLYFPPGSAIYGIAPQNLEVRSFDFILRSGRQSKLGLAAAEFPFHLFEKFGRGLVPGQLLCHSQIIPQRKDGFLFESRSLQRAFVPDCGNGRLSFFHESQAQQGATLHRIAKRRSLIGRFGDSLELADGLFQ